MNISLKRLLVVERMSEETLCFTADIALDGKVVGDVKNDGRGGCNLYHWNDYALGAKIEAYAKSVDTSGYNFEHLDSLLDGMISKAQEEKQFKRWCKTKVVFRLKVDKNGGWRTIKLLYNNTIHRPQLEKRYPNLEEVLNDRFAWLL